MSVIDKRLFFLGVLLAWGPMLLLFRALLPIVSRQTTRPLFSLTNVNWTTFDLAAVVVLEVGAIILLIRTFPGLGSPALLLIFIISFGCIALTLLFWGLMIASAMAA